MKRAMLLSASILSWPTLLLAQSTPPSPEGKPVPAAEAGKSGEAGQVPHPPGVHLVDDSEPLPPLVPRSKDLLAGHVLVGASIGPSWSVGKLANHVLASDGLGTGVAFQADAAFGVSRYVSLGVWGSLARYGQGNECSSCSGQAFAIGPFVRYHLVQGLRFDPWAVAGAGYRQVSFDDASGSKQTFSGPTWLHLQLGADYYAWSGIGLGPYLQLDLSSYSKRPEAAGSARVNTELAFGLRFLLDLPGR